MHSMMMPLNVASLKNGLSMRNCGSSNEPAGQVEGIVELTKNGNNVLLLLAVRAAILGEVFKTLVTKCLHIRFHKATHGL